jgi:hypothetical protein
MQEFLNKDPEGKLVKAAIVFKDNLYVGWRHSHIRDDIKKKFPNLTPLEMSTVMDNKWSQGFVTENGRYLPRHQAYPYAVRIGQVKMEDIRGTLTSEDLWDQFGNPYIN